MIGPRCRAAESSRRADDLRSLALSAKTSLESSRSLARESMSRVSLCDQVFGQLSCGPFGRARPIPNSKSPQFAGV